MSTNLQDYIEVRTARDEADERFSMPNSTCRSTS